MILITLTQEGQASIRSPQRLFQGTDSEKVLVISPFSRVTCPVLISATLPNGSNDGYVPMTPIELPEEYEAAGVSAWEYRITKSWTAEYGKIYFNLLVQMQKDNAEDENNATAYNYYNLTSAMVEATIEEAMVPEFPAVDPSDESAYAALVRIMASISDDVDTIETILSNGITTVLKPGETENIEENRERVCLVDETPTEGSKHLVTSGGVNTAIDEEATRADLHAEGYTDEKIAQLNAVIVTGVKGAAESSYRHGDVSISKTDIGLSEVNNTSDMNKPVSTAQRTAIDAAEQSAKNYADAGLALKQNTLTFDNAPTADSNNPVYSKGIKTAIDAVKEEIPTKTSDLTNDGEDGTSPYATESFVNSSIATNTANFIGTFANVSLLEAYAGAVTNNDYAFVVNSVIKDNGNDFATISALNAYDKTLLTNFDYAWVVNGTKFDLYRFDIVDQFWDIRVQNTTKEAVTLNTAYNRYKATVTNNTVAWDYEYTLNNSSFTAAQWAAINSGITGSLVSQITDNENAISGIKNGATINSFAGVESALSGKQNELTFDNTPTALSTNPVTSGGIKEYVDSAEQSAKNYADVGLALKQNILTFDNTPTANSNNPVISKGIKDYVDAKVTNFSGDIPSYNIRISNLENALFDFVLGKGDEKFNNINKKILPYTISKNGASYPIANGCSAILTEALGNTKQFNQLYNSGETISYSKTFTAYEAGLADVLIPNQNVLSDRKYCLKCVVSDGTVAKIVNSSDSLELTNGIYDKTVITGDIQVLFLQAGTITISFNFHDLTAMELDSISTIDEFISLYTDKFYGFDSGTLYNCRLIGETFTGKNILDADTVLVESGFSKLQDNSFFINDTSTAYGKTLWKNDCNYNGQISISFYIKQSVLSVSFNKFIFMVYYSDGTSSGLYAGTITTEYGFRYRTTEAGKIVDKISFILEPNNPTYIKDIQIEANSVYTNFEHYNERSIIFASPQILGGANNIHDAITITPNENDDFYTIKKSTVTNNDALVDIPPWNQLIQNGDMANASNWSTSASDVLLTADNNIGILQKSSQYSWQPGTYLKTGNYLNITSGLRSNRYILSFDMWADASGSIWEIGFSQDGTQDTMYISKTITTTRKKYAAIITNNTSANSIIFLLRDKGNATSSDKFYITNVALTDLTPLYGRNNEPNECPYWLSVYRQPKSITNNADGNIIHNYVYNNDNDIIWTGPATETIITSAAAITDVSEKRTNGGMLFVDGNTYQDYTKPNITNLVIYQIPQSGGQNG